MLRTAHIVSFLVIFFSAFTFGAALPHAHAADAPAATSKAVTINQDDLKKLITTLESESARADFIGNLKTIAKAQSTEAEKPADELVPLTQTLGVNTFTERMVKNYQDFLERNDLKSSTVGRIGLSILAAIVALGIIFGLRRGGKKLLAHAKKHLKWHYNPTKRIRFVGRLVRIVVNILFFGMLAYTYTQIWSLDAAYNPFQSDMLMALLAKGGNLVFVVILSVLAWEGLSTAIQAAVMRMDGGTSSRTQTILPLIQNVLSIVFIVIFSLVALSELGINIMPLLAGAGVLGIAIGFGAQTMVKDYLAGFTIILEDIMRVGDVVSVGGLGGQVERITLRKVQLRDYDGSVYTVPFSEITTIINRTKDFSMYVFNIGVAYDSDVDKVMQIMKDVAEDLRADPEWGANILEPLEMAGVDAFGDNAITIKARIKTLPIKQWSTAREYNRRLKKAFDNQGIEIPFPQRVVWHKSDDTDAQKDGAIKASLSGDAG